jgi:hypothetical protein
MQTQGVHITIEL